VSYFPLDRDVLTSSLWAQGSPAASKLWIYLLLQADPRTGIVQDAAPGIALRCGLPLDVTAHELEWLASPDQHSRTKEHDGRRIEALDGGGYRVFNYLSHQDKDYSTPRVRKWRERQADAKRPETGKRVSTVTGTTNKNTDTETEGRKEAPPAPLPPEQRAEEATKATIRRLQLELGKRLATLAEHPRSRRMVPEWCREVTAYEARDGTKVRGVADYRTVMSIDRLERSIEDADWWLGQLNGAADAEVTRGTR
jgi:hypothetical protein